MQADTLSANTRKPLQVIDLQGFFAFRGVLTYHMQLPHAAPWVVMRCPQGCSQ